MALLDRVTTLIRANLNDLVERAEDPEKLVKQLILDMENQLLQVKTQVAVTLADQHLLRDRAVESAMAATQWKRKAELAVSRNQDDLARAALERALSSEELEKGYIEQATEQATQAQVLKTALENLQQKLREANAQSELLAARHRRARALEKAAKAQAPIGDGKAAAFERLDRRVKRRAAVAKAELEVNGDIEIRLAALEKNDRIERLLAELKQKR